MGETGPQNDRFSAQHLGHGRNVGSAALPKARYFPRSTECPLMAISRHAEGSARESALPPKADIRRRQRQARFAVCDGLMRYRRHDDLLIQPLVAGKFQRGPLARSGLFRRLG